MCFALAGALLLPMATADAQTFQLPPYLGMQVFGPAEEMKRPRECDAHGCYFDDLKKWRAQKEIQRGALQEELERRAGERKKLESQR